VVEGNAIERGVKTTGTENINGRCAAGGYEPSRVSRNAEGRIAVEGGKIAARTGFCVDEDGIRALAVAECEIGREEREGGRAKRAGETGEVRNGCTAIIGAGGVASERECRRM
jgi:hypothetical protein